MYYEDNKVYMKQDRYYTDIITNKYIPCFINSYHTCVERLLLSTNGGGGTKDINSFSRGTFRLRMSQQVTKSLRKVCQSSNRAKHGELETILFVAK